MRLLDQVFQADGDIVARDKGDASLVRLPGARTIAALLPECAHRYILSDDITALCTQIAFEDGGLVGASADIVRSPASHVWLEFNQATRSRLLDCAAQDATSAQRIGLMVAGAADGRSGVAHICWENTSGLGPEAAPFAIEFDFDDPHFASHADGQTNFAVQLSSLVCLNPLFTHVRLRIDPAWAAYYHARSTDEIHYRDVIKRAIAPLCTDVPFMMAFFLLFMTGRALRAAPIDRARLNKRGRGPGKPPLLDHVELYLDRTRETHTSDDAGDSTGSRRLHHVRGHLVRRGGSVFWRSAHMRGDIELGAITHRTISLKLAA